MVVPSLARIAARSRQRSRRTPGSRPVVGSSSSSSDGRVISTLAISARRLRPPDRRDTISRDAIGQADAREGLVDAGAQRPPLQAVEASVVQEVLAHREPLVERRRLEDDAQPPPHGRRVGPHVGAEHLHRAFRGALQRRADAEQRGLAAAVGPEQRDKRARRHRQRHVVERDAAAVAVREMVT